jgi:hypothetical protein
MEGGLPEMKDRKITRRNVLALAGMAGAVGLAGMPAAAFAAEDGEEGRFFIGFDLHATGPTNTAGTFAMSGKFEDSGTSTANPTVTPTGDPNRGHLSGDQQFVGQKGTIFTHFDGVAFPNNSPHAVGKGKFKILSGTGAYAGLRGGGSFLIVVNVPTQFIGTEVGTVED